MKPATKRTIAIVLEKMVDSTLDSGVLIDREIKPQENGTAQAYKPYKNISPYGVDYLYQPKNSSTHI